MRATCYFSRGLVSCAESAGFDGRVVGVADLPHLHLECLVATVIDANAQGSAVTFANRENHASVLRGFRFTHGSGTPYGSELVGGGVYCAQGSPTIEDCHFVVNAGATISRQRLTPYRGLGTIGGGIGLPAEEQLPSFDRP